MLYRNEQTCEQQGLSNKKISKETHLCLIFDTTSDEIIYKKYMVDNGRP